MLGNIGAGVEARTATVEASESMAGGVASEIESELTEARHEEPSVSVQRLEEALKELQTNVAGLVRRPNYGPMGVIEHLVQTIRELPIECRALLAVLIRDGHLTRKQYRAAVQQRDLKSAIRLLRSNGLLVPLEGYEGDENVPVYWLPGSLSRSIKVALSLSGEIPAEVIERTAQALKQAGANEKE